MSDLINRQDAIDAVAKWFYDVFGIKESDGTATIFKRLRELPSADASLTQDRCKIDASSDLISRQTVLRCIKESRDNIDWGQSEDGDAFLHYTGALYRTIASEECLPSAERKGKWIMHIDDLFPAESTQECSQCHNEQPLTIDNNFCPNCGADMRSKLRQTTDTDGYADQSGLASAT